MRHYEERTVTSTGKYFLNRTCDLCGKETPNQRNWNTKPNDFDVDTVVVKHECGHSSRSGGDTTIKSYGVCIRCFNELLVPWFEAQGVEPQTESYDW